VAIASRDSNQIVVLQGNGRGEFESTRSINVPGKVTAFASGDFNRNDSLEDLAVAITGSSGSKLLVFEGPGGALQATPEVFSLASPAASVTSGYFDSDAFVDIAVVAGNQLVVVHGRDRKLASRQAAPPAVVETRSFGFALKSVASGDFAGDASIDLAILGDDGNVYFLVNSAGAKDGDSIRNRELRKLGAGPWPGAS